MEQRLMGEVFALLKRALRARRMSYEALANELNVSLPTVKRLFVEQDCKFSRLCKICDLLELSVADLMDTARRRSEEAQYLSEQVEQCFAEHPALFYFYVLLREPLSPEAIAANYQLSAADTRLYCRDLERLELISLSPQGRVTVLSDGPYNVRQDGPLKALYESINVRFLQHCLRHSEQANTQMISLSRQLRADSARQIQSEIETLLQNISRYARQDRLISPNHELETYKWSFASAQVSMMQCLQVGKHRDNKSKSAKSK